jgi:hypothetical protein
VLAGPAGRGFPQIGDPLPLLHARTSINRSGTVLIRLSHISCNQTDCHKYRGKTEAKHFAKQTVHMAEFSDGTSVS